MSDRYGLALTEEVRAKDEVFKRVVPFAGPYQNILLALKKVEKIACFDYSVDEVALLRSGNINVIAGSAHSEKSQYISCRVVFAGSRPVLSRVVNPQDFDALLFHSVDSDVRQREEKELSRSFLATHATTIWPLFQRADGLV
jgi:hypothetical protein